MQMNGWTFRSCSLVYISSRRLSSQVETVGDCYVAATGLPDPRKDHDLAMVRFARDCLSGMQTVLKELEGTYENQSSLPRTANHSTSIPSHRSRYWQ